MHRFTLLTALLLFTPQIARAGQPNQLFLESQSRWGFAETVSRLQASLKKNGWKIPKVHDLQAAMKKSGHSVLPVKVLEACKPALAVKILGQPNERSASVMMPCRISVYTKRGGKTFVSRLNIAPMATMLDGRAKKTMGQAAAEMEKVIKSLIR